MVAAKQIKARNPTIAVVVWYDSVRIYQQNKTLNPKIRGGCTTGNFEPGVFLDTHPTPCVPAVNARECSNPPSSSPNTHTHTHTLTLVKRLCSCCGS